MDLTLTTIFSKNIYGFEDGAEDFFSLLSLIEKVPYFNMGWRSGSLSAIDEIPPEIEADWGIVSQIKAFVLWADRTAYLSDSKERIRELYPKGDYFSLHINDNSEDVLPDQEDQYYDFSYNWGGLDTRLTGEFRQSHPQFGVPAQQFILLIEAITKWKRPQHLECGPVIYKRDHHPLDRARSSIRWIGWVPFELNPSDVPEAALVQVMNGGTLIATQMDFWQAFERHPFYSKEAIERAQEVELRLNQLGVLPTSVELNRGDWGQ